MPRRHLPHDATLEFFTDVEGNLAYFEALLSHSTILSRLADGSLDLRALGELARAVEARQRPPLPRPDGSRDLTVGEFYQLYVLTPFQSHLNSNSDKVRRGPDVSTRARDVCLDPRKDWRESLGCGRLCAAVSIGSHMILTYDDTYSPLIWHETFAVAQYSSASRSAALCV